MGESDEGFSGDWVGGLGVRQWELMLVLVLGSEILEAGGRA